MSKNKMSKSELQKFNELYQYVRKEIMNYDDNQALSKAMVLRLKGLTVGKFMQNRNQKDMANYSYDVILATFQIYKNDIVNGMKSNRFHDEMHRFNYAMKIAETKLNDVYMRFSKAEKARDKTKSVDVAPLEHNGATYTKKTKDNTNKKLNDLW
ncbi:MAG: hypothetical protein ACLTBR_03015 [Anaerostipes sp.]|uniref:hypothetical protein n=1 Tax=Anaerostipes sp. TaxID=1872530 RepID=UPI00399556E7